MGLTNEHVGPKILAKIKIYVLTRAELLFQVCYEIPCTMRLSDWNLCLTYLASTYIMLLLSKGITWQKHCYFQIPYETKVKFWKKVG